MAGPFGWGCVEEGWRKGPWTAEEDKLLIVYVSMNGEGRWNSVSRLAGLKRNGKSCRLRWVNYLRPDLKRGQITPHEENIILELHARWGNRWSTIARSLPGRTDNEIKNYWRTHFKKNTKSSQGLRKSKSQTRRRQQQKNLQFEQQQQQQHANMTKVMPQLEEGDYKLSTAQNRPEMVFMYPNLDEHCPSSTLNGDNSLAEASFDESVWGSLWNFYDPHAEFDYNCS